MGRILVARRNRRTPSHSNKAGVRYRYYVSHALLQRRKDEAGGVARVPAAQVEATVVEAVRQSVRKNAPTEGHSDVSDREAIARFVERIVISPKSIETFAAAFDEGDGLLFDIVKYVGGGWRRSSITLGPHQKTIGSLTGQLTPRGSGEAIGA